MEEQTLYAVHKGARASEGPIENELLSTSEAAEVLGISSQAVRRAVREGRLYSEEGDHPFAKRRLLLVRFVLFYGLRTRRSATKMASRLEKIREAVPLREIFNWFLAAQDC